jgi:hypothetical protein
MYYNKATIANILECTNAETIDDVIETLGSTAIIEAFDRQLDLFQCTDEVCEITFNPRELGAY